MCDSRQPEDGADSEVIIPPREVSMANNTLMAMLDKYRESAGWRNYQRRIKLANRLTSWMRHIPIVGRLSYAFWFSMIESGGYQTLKPRWGSMTFAFLNDGIKPTVWHTWHSITTDDAAIYIHGAPKNRGEAGLEH